MGRVYETSRFNRNSSTCFLGGGILTFLGAIIKHFNAGDILNGFDEKKYDKEKVSRIVGMDFLIIGLSVIIIALISIFIDKKYYNAIMITQGIIIVLGLIKALYDQFFKCGKN